MLLTKLVQGLGALSLVHLAVAADPLAPRAQDSQDSGYGVECWGCGKTVTEIYTETTTCIETETKTETTTCIETETETETEIRTATETETCTVTETKTRTATTTYENRETAKSACVCVCILTLC